MDEIRLDLQTRVDSLETKLDKSTSECNARIETLRMEYEAEMRKLREEKRELELKIIRLQSDVQEVQERTREFMLPKR